MRKTLVFYNGCAPNGQKSDDLKAWPVGPRLLAIKFLETCVLLFMPDNDSKGHIAEGLRKITDDMKAKNRKDRAGFVSSGEKEARKSALSAAKVGPPKLELVMGRKFLKSTCQIGEIGEVSVANLIKLR
ncbi:cyclase-associated protein 1-like protein [Tanacetum coccineum]